MLRAGPILKISDSTSELNQAAQGLTQSSFKFLQWWRFLSLSEQLQFLLQFFMNIYFPQIQTGTSCIAACIHSLILSPCPTLKIWFCLPYTFHSREQLRASSLQPSLLQADQAQLLQSLLMHIVLQPWPVQCPTAGLCPGPQLSLVPGSSRLVTVLVVSCHQCQIQGKDCCLSSTLVGTSL